MKNERLTALGAAGGRGAGWLVVCLAACLMVGGTGAWAAARITARDIAKNAVRTKHIAGGAVTRAKLAGGSVTSAKIGSKAVTPAKLAKAPAARANLTTAEQSIPNTTPTAIEFDDEDFDSHGLFDLANGSRLVAPIAGIYEITGGIDWAINATGERTTAISINGTAVAARVRDEASAGRHAQNVATLVHLAAGDFVQLEGTQTSGGNLEAVNFLTTFLAMRWVGPA